MKKQLIPLLTLASILCISCNSTGQIVNPSSEKHNSESKNSKSDYSSIYAPNNDVVKLLKKVPEPEFNYNDIDDGFNSFLTKFNNFNSSFSEQYVTNYFDGSRNDTISPLSIYFALAQAGAVTAGTTQQEIFDALNVSSEDALKYSPILYKITNRVVYGGENRDKITSIEDINNSFWFEKTLPLKQSGVDTLVNSFFCETFAADFLHNPKSVSGELNNYVINKTRGLINPELDLNNLVRMVIVNTLYMKDQWSNEVNELSFESKARDFTNYDLTKANLKFLLGSYNRGIAYNSNDFTSFYARTANNFKIRFMVPKEGKKINEIFNQRNILEMHNAEYTPSGKENYSTRCIFPEFTASASDGLDLMNMFKERGVRQFFVKGDFSNIMEETEEDIACSAIKHMTKLIVDKTGVEGAAVTIVVTEATSVGPGAQPIYEDFVVDKAFGFEISDWYDVPLFTGIISKI